jgi:hypothetical protein
MRWITFSTRVNSGEIFCATTRISTSFELHIIIMYPQRTQNRNKIESLVRFETLNPHFCHMGQGSFLNGGGEDPWQHRTGLLVP